jgi:hypothetical protein
VVAVPVLVWKLAADAAALRTTGGFNVSPSIAADPVEAADEAVLLAAHAATAVSASAAVTITQTMTRKRYSSDGDEP